MVGAAALVAAVLWAFPPFFVIDDGSGGARHAALGRRPAWDPPSADEAEDALRRLVGPAAPGTAPGLRVERNGVSLGIELLAVAVAAASLLALTGRRRHAPSERRHPPG